MATEARNSHQTSTSDSDQQSVKLSREAVKAADHTAVSICLQKERVEDDREAATKPEEKAEDIQVDQQPPVIVKTPEETPVVDIPRLDNVKVDKESTAHSLSTHTVAEVQNQQNEYPSIPPPVVEKSTEEQLKIVEEKEQPASESELVSAQKEQKEQPASESELVSAQKEQKEQPASESELVSAQKEQKEQPHTSCVPESSIEPPHDDRQPVDILPLEKPIEVTEKEIVETVLEPPKEKQPASDVHPVREPDEVTAEKISESAELPKVNELPVGVHPVEVPEETAKNTSESIEPPKKREQPDEIIPEKESEAVAKEITDSSELLKNKEQPEEAFLVKESGGEKQKETSSSREVEKQEPATEPVSVEKEKREQPESSCAPESSVDPPEKEKQAVEDVQVEEPAEMIQKQIIETEEPPKEKKQPFEVHAVQESGEVTLKEISESIELTKETELQVEVHLVKEVETTAKENPESIEPPKNIKQPDEVLPVKETGGVLAKETSESSGPLRSKEQPDESFATTESNEAKETHGSPINSEVQKQEPEVVEVKDGQKELPEINNRVIVNRETVNGEESLAPKIDIIPPLEGYIHKEEPCALESDEQYSFGKVTQPNPTTNSGEGSEKEQPATEFVNAEKEPMEEPDTICVTKLTVEAPKKEEISIEILPVKEPVEVVTKEIIETDEPPKKIEPPIEVHLVSEFITVPEEKEQVTEVHLVQDSRKQKAVDNAPKSFVEISEPNDLPKEKEQTTEAHLVQASREIVPEKISESDELPKENVPVLEVHPEQQSTELMPKEASELIEPPKSKQQPDVLPEKESESTVKEVSASSVPPEKTEQPDDVIPVTESEEVKEKEAGGATLGAKEVENPEPEVIKKEDVQGELPEITIQNQNNHIEIETEAIVKGETFKDGKSLTLGDEVNPPLEGGQVHKEEEQCSVESDKQDLLGQVAQPDVELATRDISPQHLEDKASKENENKELSPIDLVKELSEVEEREVEKVEDAKEEKIEKTSAEVAEKSIDDNKASEVLVAETKIESVKDDKSALIETGSAENVDEKLNVNETPKEFQESEVKVKDKETMTTGDEIPKLDIQNKEPSKKEDDEIKVSENLRKEVPSKPTHKQSHNLLSKVKQSLVKAKKAIIGKSPGSKALSSEAKDDIKVK